MAQPVPSAQPVVLVQAPASNIAPRNLGVAYALWFFLGLFGAHQFYLGKTGRGALYLFTLGGFFIGVFIDLFTLPTQVRMRNAGAR